ncbi:MAG TPA: radical SAM protein [Elusimicrobiales bacterium]|nr:radical SAM protein [Elusimicrobiales bacterium]HOL63205.1 radical SAM protein [Elusimicrobiales bacterium]HPO94447.1 radical SAM protein [Elusimicrobiales bacterium]
MTIKDKILLPFISPQKSYYEILNLIKNRYYLDYKGPEGHIISLTRKCSNLCKYCIADSGTAKNSMDSKTAIKIIDFIFTIPRQSYYIEFTGGEPFLNLDVLKEALSYSSEKSKKFNKKIYFSVVSNLTELKEEAIKLILKYKITICTSLDGPKEIHDLNRPDSYEKVISNIKKIVYYAKTGHIEYPNIITTITKKSLKRHKDIIEEYLKLGVMRVQLGFIEPYGRARLNWKEFGYSYQDYLEFYEKALNHIININIKKGIPIYEKGAYLLLHDLIKNKKPRYRAIDIYHRLAYDINANIYPSDEARILGENGDKTFLIGSAKKIKNFENFIKKPTTQKFMLENFQELTRPLCSRCDYSLYCKVGGYYNRIAQNSISGNMITNERCRLFKGIFDILSKLMKNRENMFVFNNWLNNYR